MKINKMKWVFALIMCVSITSCGMGNPADDKALCLQSVQKAYPNCLVWPLPKDDYKYIVADTIGNVIYVETMSESSTKVTAKIVIKQEKK